MPFFTVQFYVYYYFDTIPNLVRLIHPETSFHLFEKWIKAKVRTSGVGAQIPSVRGYVYTSKEFDC